MFDPMMLMKIVLLSGSNPIVEELYWAHYLPIYLVIIIGGLGLIYMLSNHAISFMTDKEYVTEFILDDKRTQNTYGEYAGAITCWVIGVAIIWGLLSLFWGIILIALERTWVIWGTILVYIFIMYSGRFFVRLSKTTKHLLKYVHKHPDSIPHEKVEQPPYNEM